MSVATKTKTMWAHVLHRPGHMTFEKTRLPEIGEHDVLMRVEAVLTCGTDLKTFRRGHPIIPLPMTIGHEYAGEVVAVGPSVEDFREGDRVATVHSGPCLNCHYCRRGRENLCETITEEMVWGGFAEFVKLPQRVHRSNTMKIPVGMTFERCAFLEPVACVLHGLNQMDLKQVDTALILGAGPMGLIFLQLLRRRGVKNVVVAGKKLDRLERAHSLGATAVIDVERDPVAPVVRQFNAGHGADCVIECVGRTEVWASAVDLVSKGGQVLLYGGCPAGTTLNVDTRRIHYDEISLVGTFHFNSAEVREAFELLRTGAIQVDPLITGTYSLSQVPTAFERLMAGDGIKYLIHGA
jgi:L-iditol 2-dehydrogenase